MKSFAAFRRGRGPAAGGALCGGFPVDARGQYLLELTGDFPFVAKRLGFSAHDPPPPLRHTARLLRETDRSIAEIATAVGFADQSYFDRRFRRRFGRTPRQFREVG
jgi:hypothetical protein